LRSITATEPATKPESKPKRRAPAKKKGEGDDAAT
jgi:hypothetical protein